MNKKINTIVIGGGQAGLSASYCLKEKGIEHIVLEKNRIAETWKSRRWDSFTLVTPNWQLRLPGYEYQGDNPEGFLSRAEVVNYIENYASSFNPPVSLGIEVIAVKKNGKNGYLLETSAGNLRSENVILATGTFQEPKIPDCSLKIDPGIIQMHSSRYYKPDKLPEGNVLVVGSAQSGCQIADELQKAGRKVYLSTGKSGRAPRRHRGKDFTEWFEETGMVERTADQLDSPTERFNPNPAVTGKDGGYNLNLHEMASRGIQLLGHVKDAENFTVYLEEDLTENLKMADNFEEQLKKGIDGFIEKSGIDAPEEEGRKPEDGFNIKPRKKLDLKSEGITSLIWACGYKFDYSLVKLPVLDDFGYPVQNQGITEYPGLYFLGMHWLNKIKSGLFAGVGEDAAHIAGDIANR